MALPTFNKVGCSLCGKATFDRQNPVGHVANRQNAFQKVGIGKNASLMLVTTLPRTPVSAVGSLHTEI
jgi:hypothetical protein